MLSDVVEAEEYFSIAQLTSRRKENQHYNCIPAPILYPDRNPDAALLLGENYFQRHEPSTVLNQHLN